MPKNKRYPRLVLEVICPCGKHINVRCDQPQTIKHCWNCNRDVRVSLSPGGAYMVHIKAPMTFHFDDHADRRDKSTYHEISLEM